MYRTEFFWSFVSDLCLNIYQVKKKEDFLSSYKFSLLASDRTLKDVAVEKKSARTVQAVK